MSTTLNEAQLVKAAEAIHHHYDIGNEFYQIWLDQSLTYSCAVWDGATTLEEAQQNKIRYHLESIDADSVSNVLDIGCGWGGTLTSLNNMPNVKQAVGLTLSEEQAKYISQQGWEKVEVLVKNWQEYKPTACFDGIISVGAFEHFATPLDTADQKIEIYRGFFEACRGWLKPGGHLSLQTIAYGNMPREHASSFINEEIFPNADLPTLTEICQAAEGVFEILGVQNARIDYAKTCEEWYRRLSTHSAEAIDLVGPDTVNRYLRYLKMSAFGFQFGKIQLLRVQMKAIQ